MPPKRPHDYTRTTIDIRQDFYWVIKKRHWNVRKLLEEKVESMISQEDLDYMESIRLEKELEKRKKSLEESQQKVEVRV